MQKYGEYDVICDSCDCQYKMASCTNNGTSDQASKVYVLPEPFVTSTQNRWRTVRDYTAKSGLGRSNY